MTDIREKLNARRDSLRASSESDERWVSGGADPTSTNYRRASRNIDELRTVESILATMQLADAQHMVAAAQREVAQAQREANVEADVDRRRSEEIAFWGRRFLTTLGIAHAAALFAVLTSMTRPDAPDVALYKLYLLVVILSAGTFMAATTPLLRLSVASIDDGKRKLRDWVKNVVDYWWPAISAAAFLVAAGLMISVAFEAYIQREAPSAAVGAEGLEPPTRPL